jgi:S1-C subfamily serine protease
MPGAIATAMLLALPASAFAQDDRAAAREVVKRWQDAIVNVRVVLKMRMSMSGREMQSTEEPIEAVGTVIDPDGLTVLSLSALNPAAMMNKIIGGMAGGQERLDIGGEPTDLKIRTADGREVTAKIVLRDEDLDLAFIRPAAKPEKPLVAVNLSDPARPALLDPVVILSRLGRVGGWTSAASIQTVGAIIEKPRTFYVIENGMTGGMGTPAFTPSGKVVGVLTIRSVQSGRIGMMSMMAGPQQLGLLPVILPAADVLEIAKQAPDK